MYKIYAAEDYNLLGGLASSTEKVVKGEGGETGDWASFLVSQGWWGIRFIVFILIVLTMFGVYFNRNK